MTEREKVFARLEELGVSYEVTEHPAVFTIGEMDALGLTAKGEVCKNLFLRDAKGRRAPTCARLPHSWKAPS